VKARHGPRTLHTRSSERGVALFIVVMVITLLTAVGLFAARTASMVDTASGYNRQAAQTSALAAFAGRFAAAELGLGRANWYIQQMRAGSERCPSNRVSTGPLGNLPCYKLDDVDVLQRIADQSQHAALVPSTRTTPGSLGPPLGIETAESAGLQPALMVELLDGFQTSGMPGMDRGGGPNRFINVQLTVTGWAQVRAVPPDQVVDPWCGAASASTAASVQAVRAYITVPNLPAQ